MALPLPANPARDWLDLQRNFDAIARRFGAIVTTDLATAVLNAFLKLAVSGDHAVAFGSFSIAVTANNSGGGSTAHNLPAAPTVAVAVTDQLDWFPSLASKDATNVSFNVRQYQAVNATVNVGVYWIAIS